MAHAKDYDQYEDSGLAFSEDQVKNYNPEGEGYRRLDYLVELHNVLHAMNRLNYGPIVWAGKYSSRIKYRATGLCAALLIEQPHSSDFFAKDNEFMLKAQKVNNWTEWADSLVNECDVYLTYVVTLGRRASAAQGWSREQKSMSNKLVNQVKNQKITMDKFAETIRAYVLKTDRPGM